MVTRLCDAHRGRRLLLLLIVAAMLCPAVGQALPLQLGSLNLMEGKTATLSERAHLTEGLNSMMFCTGVGGIAFGGVAAWPEGMKAIALSYDSGRPDGARLQATLTDAAGVAKTVTAPIYDWQLVPIARFAAGDQDSCFTLFGQMKDPKETEKRMRRGDKILNYHSAFADTLLGLQQAAQTQPLRLRPQRPAALSAML